MADLLGVHPFEELLAVFLVELHEHVGSLLLVGNEVEKPFGLPEVEALEELGDVGGVHPLDFGYAACAVVLVDEAFHALDVLVGEFFH